MQHQTFNRAGFDWNREQNLGPHKTIVVKHSKPKNLRALVREQVKNDAFYWDIVRAVYAYYATEQMNRVRTRGDMKAYDLQGYAERRTKDALGTILKEAEIVKAMGKELTVKQYRDAH